MGLDIGTGDNRWQGYSHEELYAMLHSGPGPAAAGATADRWTAMAGALSDIQQDISAGVAASGATWVGDAGDVARNALNPLGDWAHQASAAADVMRISTELQGDLLSKARADMPAPMPIPQQPTQISQLVTAQVDYELAEVASDVAAQQAFQVMAQYESGTTDNTNTLGEFDQPPTLHVDTTPITGTAIRTRSGEFESPRRGSRTPRTARTGSISNEEPVATNGNSSRATIPTEPTPPAEATSETPPPTRTSTTPNSSSTSSTSDSATPASPTEPTTPPTPPPASGTSPATGTSAATTESAAPNTSPSSAPPTDPNPTPTNQFPTQTTPTSSRDRNNANASTGGATPAAPRMPMAAVVPTARRPTRDDEPDDEHESKYLILADDIYGDRQAYSPPVIGEHRPPR